MRALAFTRKAPGATRRDGVGLERFAPRLLVGNAPLHESFRRRVAARIDSFRPDVVVAHTPVPFPAEMAALAARAARVPFVVTYHAGRLTGSSRGLRLLAALDRATLERRMLSGAAGLIAVSPFVRDHALRRHRDRVALVPPGVDASRFFPDGPPGPRAILYVGPLDRSYRWKGVDVLWRAFPRVRRRLPDACLTLVGEGDRREEFARKARALGDAVRIPGRLPDDALVAEYRRAAVVVLPSTTDAEAFGMVAAEANACARPVVASRVGGLPDFVREGENGLLARPGDPRHLAGRLLAVLGDPRRARRMGERGRRRVVAHHDWDRLARLTETVLEEAAGRGPPSRGASGRRRS